MTENLLAGILANEYEKFKSIKMESITRPSVGELSIEKEFTPLFIEIDKLVKMAIKYGDQLDRNSLNVYNELLSQLRSIIDNITRNSTEEFINNKQKFLDKVEDYKERFKALQPQIVAAATIKDGLLNKESLTSHSDELTSSLNDHANEIITTLNDKANAILEEARNSAETVIRKAHVEAAKIETGARNTAEGISVETAQTQFKEAQKPIYIQLGIWGLFSATAMAAFFYFIHGYLVKEIPPEWTWQLAVYAGLRVTFLGAIASIASYCMKIFKSQLHILQTNTHRIRLANSMEALIEAAHTPEQRDVILVQLVNAITNFGNSGLIPNESDCLHTPNLTIDSIRRNVVAGSGAE